MSLALRLGICAGVLLRSSIALQARQQLSTNGSCSDLQPGSRVQAALSANNSIAATPADSAAQAQIPGTHAASPGDAVAHAAASEQIPVTAQPDRAAGAAAEQGVPAGDAQPLVAAGEAGGQLDAHASQPATMAGKLPRVHIGKRRSFDSMNDIEGMSPPSSRQRSEAWQVQRRPPSTVQWSQIIDIARCLDGPANLRAVSNGPRFWQATTHMLRCRIDRTQWGSGCGRRLSHVDQRHVARAGWPAPAAHRLVGRSHQRPPRSEPYEHGEPHVAVWQPTQTSAVIKSRAAFQRTQSCWLRCAVKNRCMFGTFQAALVRSVSERHLQWSASPGVGGASELASSTARRPQSPIHAANGSHLAEHPHAPDEALTASVLQEPGEQPSAEATCCAAQLDRMGSSDQLDILRGTVPDAAQDADAAGSRTLQVRMVPATKEVTPDFAIVILMSQDDAVHRSSRPATPCTECTGLCIRSCFAENGHMIVAQLVDVEFELYKSYQVGQHGEQADEVRLPEQRGLKPTGHAARRMCLRRMLGLQCVRTFTVSTCRCGRLLQVSTRQFVRFLVDSPLPTPVTQQQPANGTSPSQSASGGAATADEAADQAAYGTFHMQYWLGSALIAVSVVDVLPKCLSSVYMFWDKRCALHQSAAWHVLPVSHSPSPEHGDASSPRPSRLSRCWMTNSTLESSAT
jgi:Arginine-tRNA-protein transferase, C terminus